MILNLGITLNSGISFLSEGWIDRPMKKLLEDVHRTIPNVRDVEIVSTTYPRENVEQLIDILLVSSTGGIWL